MTAALITIAGAFLLELGAAIFAAGKLWQRVADIEKTVLEIKKIVFAGFDCKEKGDDSYGETQEVRQDRSPSQRKKEGVVEEDPTKEEKEIRHLKDLNRA